MVVADLTLVWVIADDDDARDPPVPTAPATIDAGPVVYSPVATATPSPAPTPVPTVPSVSPAPTPDPTVEAPAPNQTSAPPPAGSIAESICSVGWPDCDKVLRVARCESTDYYAPFDGVHIGTFQLNFRLHAWRFAALGLDYFVHGDIPYYNSAVAYWVYKDRLAATGWGWGAWPVCGWR